MSSELTKEVREQYHDEYVEASLNLTHYSNLRFAIFTVMLAIETGLMGVSFGVVKVQVPGPLSVLAKAGGIIATFVFWIFHERVIAYRGIFLQRAILLEEKLSYDLYSSRTKPMLGFLGTSFAARLFFVALALFWIGAFFIQ
jgi:hypothetical protein